MILGHHGFGEELLVPLLASGGATLSAIALVTRAKLDRVGRWLRRR